MPRTFLISNRRYEEDKGGCSNEGRPSHQSPYNQQRADRDDAESPTTTATAATTSIHVVNDLSSYDCPEELYNLTKLAEVAVATEKLFQEQTPRYAHKLFDKSRIIASKVEESQPANSPDSTSEHECHDCGKRYSTSSNLARHRQTHRSPADKKARRCPHCDKLYVSMPAFSMHVRTHNQGCKCLYCGKCFSRPWLLQGHIRTHTGEKPFKCHICQKAFADKSNLRAHVQTHSNTKPHVCTRCGKAFALKSYLYKHEESSCMRVNGGPCMRDNVSDKSVSSPSSSGCTSPATPPSSLVSSVIVSPPHLKLQHNLPDSSTPSTVIRRAPIIQTSPFYYLSGVITPNPDRILYAGAEPPPAQLGTILRQHHHQDQPMDYSNRSVSTADCSSNSGYGSMGVAITA